MTIRDQLRRSKRRGQEPARGEGQDLTRREIEEMRRKRQRRREMEQHAGPDDGREMFKAAEEAGRCQAPVDCDLNPGSPEFAGLMADTQGSMRVDDMVRENGEGDMADLATEGQSKGSFTDFVMGLPDGRKDETVDNGGLL